MLIIAEKPELAKAIAAAFTTQPKRIANAYFDCGIANGMSVKITWCFGHMLALKDPEDYDPKYKKWSMHDLPIIMIPWSKKPIEDKKVQLKAILALIKTAKVIVHAGDPDDEGQLLVDEIIDFANTQTAITAKSIKRLLINDNNVSVVKKALASMKDNTHYKGLSNSAEARSVADQLYGYNMTRAYTLSANSGGVLSIGRVQTPILGLVVRRDLENESHQKSFYYDIEAIFKFDMPNNKNINQDIIETKARYLLKPSDNVDEKKRLLDRAAVEILAKDIYQQKARIKNIKTDNKQQAAPLPYNLLKLQMDCSRKYGLNADVVQNITQVLREKHKLITYNRSDCEYLNDEHHVDAGYVLAAIAATAVIFAGIIKKADPALKSRAFNNAKVTAHHAIIPTQTSVNINILTQDEARVYQLIARQYIAQFFPIRTYEETKIIIQCPVDKIDKIDNLANNSKNATLFEARSILAINDGWKILYKNDTDNKDVGKDVVDCQNNLALLTINQLGINTKATVLDKETRPKPLYTRDTLLGDLSRVAKYIKDDKLRQLLLDKDKGKSGEHGGIGTPATRAAIISGLFERGFLIDKGKFVISTPLAREFYTALPDQAKYPDMTALWHEQQKLISEGKLSVLEFIKGMNAYIATQIANVKINKIKIISQANFNLSKGNANFKASSSENSKITPTKSAKIYACTSCGSNLRKIQGKDAFFWGCTAYPACKKTYKNGRDKPVLE